MDPLTASLDRYQSRAFQLVKPGNKVLLLFGRGAGKSFLDRLIIHTQALGEPGRHIGLLMPTLKQARQVFWPALFDEYAGPLRPWVKSLNKSLLEVEYKNGSRLTTWGAENADGIRGQRFSTIVQDESDEIEPSVEQAVVEPTFSRSGVNAIWVKSGTPKRGRHGILYRDFRLASDSEPGYHVVRVKSSESPQVDQTWLARVKANTDPGIFAREYDVDFDSAEGLVYAFDESFHIRVPHNGVHWSEFWIGADWGWNDPGVLLLCGIHGSGNDATLWALDEIYQTETPNHIWDGRAAAWTKKYGSDLGRRPPTLAADRSRPDRIRDYVNAGCNARGADNDIEAGVARIADLLAIRQADGRENWARLYIHPRCKNLLREFGLYRRKKDPRDPERYLEQIEDKNNHALDALRYVALERFGRPATGRNVVAGA